VKERTEAQKRRNLGVRKKGWNEGRKKRGKSTEGNENV